MCKYNEIKSQGDGKNWDKKEREKNKIRGKGLNYDNGGEKEKETWNLSYVSKT